MVRITDKQLDIALRMASQYCYEDDIAMMKAVDTQDYPMTEKIRKRFDRMLKKSERRERWEELRLEIPMPAKKVAVIILVMGTLLFAGMMTIQPVRAAIVDVIIRWYDQYIGIMYTAEGDMPTEIMEVILPDDLPETWGLEQIIKVPGEVEYAITSPEGEKFRLSQIVIGEEEQWIDNEEVSSRSVQITKRQKGILYFYPDRVSLVWKAQYVFILRGGESSDETLLQIAKEIVSP